jgi:hypothetical protein
LLVWVHQSIGAGLHGGAGTAGLIALSVEVRGEQVPDRHRDPFGRSRKPGGVCHCGDDGVLRGPAVSEVRVSHGVESRNVLLAILHQRAGRTTPATPTALAVRPGDETQPWMS